MDERAIAGSRRSQYYVRLGFALAALYWLLEAAIHAFAFRSGNYFSQLMTSDPHELWKRILVTALLVGFGFIAQRGINVIRRTDAALRSSEKKYRTLVQEASNPIFVLDQDGRFIEANQATETFFERSAKALSDTTFSELANPEGTPNPIDTSLLVTNRRALEMACETDGRRKVLLLNLAAVQFEDGPNLYFGIGQDISERKLAERKLQQAHAELDQIFQTASSAMRLIDTNFNVLKTNQAFARLSGVEPAAAVGTKCYDVFAGDYCHTDRCSLVRVSAGEDEIKLEVVKRRRDDTSVPCLLTARPFVATDGALLGIVESFSDITELSRVQEELRTERDRLRHILFQQFEGVGIVRSDFTLEYQNTALADEIGDLQGSPCYAAFLKATAPCPACLMREALASGRPQHREFSLPDQRSFEHTYTPFRDANGEEKVLVLLRDITDRKASRAAVMRSEQLAAIGELAAGVAHEINNPINGVLNYAEILLDNHRDLESVTKIATCIVSESERVAKIVQSLLAFSRRDAENRVAADVGELLREILTITKVQLRRSFITVHCKVEESLPQVVCTPQEIQQVFLNLINNARDALNERYPDSSPDKVLEITACRDDIEAGRFVTVWFRDQGTGIPENLIDKVTRPFFSTKPKGIGTGLGLTISSDIVTEHGGRLLLESRKGQYTRVGVRLPLFSLAEEGTGDERVAHPGC